MQLFSKKSLDFKTQIANLGELKTLTLCALFVALYVILYFFNIRITPTLELRPGYLAIAASALYGGPIMGMLVGALGDVLSMIVTGGQGASFFFGFTASYALMGFFFGLVLHGSTVTIARGLLAAVVEFLISLFLNTYWLMIMYYNGENYGALFLTRIPKCIIMLGISTIIIYIVMKAFNQALVHARLA